MMCFDIVVKSRREILVCILSGLHTGCVNLEWVTIIAYLQNGNTSAFFPRCLGRVIRTWPNTWHIVNNSDYIQDEPAKQLI